MPYGLPSEAKRRAKFLKRVLVTEGCWIWTGSTTVLGYGQIFVARRRVYAHRFSYELVHGKIPPGLELDHLCRNPSCVNPDHLEPVTHAENCRRGRAGSNNAMKTHCPHGHEYTAANTYVYKGRRNCRECAADRRRARREARV